jgi:PAS domain S-box-containing protein
MSKENRAKLKQRIDNVLKNKNKVIDNAYTKSLEELVEELKTYQIELEFQNEELERIQHELINSRNAYQQLYHYAPVGYVILDEHFRIKQFNKTFDEFFKTGVEISNSFDFRKLIQPDEQNRFYNFARKLHKQGEAESIELAFVPTGSNDLFLAVHGNIEYHKDVIQYRLTLVDISDRRKAEESSFRVTEQFKTLFVNSPLPLFIHDKETGEIIDANRKALITNDCSSIEELRQGDFWLSAPYSKEDAFNMIKSARLEADPKPYEWKSKGPDGKVFWEEIYLSSMLINGVERIIVTTVDITDRKLAQEKLSQSEKRYRSFFYGSKDALLVLDFHTRKFIAVNEQAVTLFCADSHSQMLQLGPAKLSPEFQENGLPSADLSVKMMEKAIWEGSHFFEWKHKRLNGELFDASVLLTAFEMDGQTLMQTTVRDITESKLAAEKIKQSETKLKELNKSLLDANQTKDKLFSVISHDLRSPAAAVFGLAGLLHENFDNLHPAEMKKIAKSIYSSSGNLSELLDNLLEWSRLQNGTTIPDLKRESVEDIITYVVDNLRQLAELKNILLLVHVEDQLMAYYDRQMMASVIRNLLSNAIKFTPRGGKIVIMAAKYDYKTIAIEINDTGIGIPESFKDELFTVNNTKSRPGTDGERSSGLGLILCKEFMQLHKGSISVDSKEGKGSSFKVLLPIEPE